jgi:hypothetical protein
MKNLKVKLMLSIIENGCCNIFTPWKVKSDFSLNGQNKSPQNSDYHFHPDLVVNIFENNIPASVICANCAESITHNKIPKNSFASKVDFGIGDKIGLENPSI